jgi:subtilisin family serine protease
MRKLGLALAACLIAVGAAASGATSAPSGSAAPGMFKASATGRYIVIAPNKAAFNSALSSARSDARVALNMSSVNAFTLNASASVAQAFAKSHRVKVIPDRIESLVRPGMHSEMGMIPPSQVNVQAVVNRLKAIGHTANPFSNPTASPSAVLSGFTADPAFGLGGGAPNDPMWSIERIGGPTAWQTNGGDDDVLVAVADTGLDYTHTELADRVVARTDISATEGLGNEICKDLIANPPLDDQDLATLTGGPVDGDFNGHGSWIGGNIAGEVDSNAVNGTAPGVSLLEVKISQWCGSAFDSEIMSGFLWAAEHGADVVSISFGGYLDRSDPFQDASYDLYESVVEYAAKLGTTIVASAGNEHVRVSNGGRVVSHGPLSVPPGLDPGDDLFGLYEVPGGIKGVVDVSSTNNVVNAPSATCPEAGSTTDAHPWCKLTTDPHQPFGVGTQSQLTYYSNYGPRIDVAGPGGARKYNLPAADRGGTEGWPFTGMDSYVSDNSPGGNVSEADGFKAWEDFSITSNYAFEIPCVIFDGSSADPATDGYYGVPTQTGFDDEQCYSTIQGTSMAAPHASATLALIASAHPELRFEPAMLIKFLKKSAVTPAKSLTNATPPLSATDKTNTDLTNLACPDGYCHLGGKAIKAKEAYGAGLVNAAGAVAGGFGGP